MNNNNNNDNDNNNNNVFVCLPSPRRRLAGSWGTWCRAGPPGSGGLPPQRGRGTPPSIVAIA